MTDCLICAIQLHYAILVCRMISFDIVPFRLLRSQIISGKQNAVYQSILNFILSTNRILIQFILSTSTCPDVPKNEVIIFSVSNEVIIFSKNVTVFSKH